MKRKRTSTKALALILSVCILGTAPVFAEEFYTDPAMELNSDQTLVKENEQKIIPDENDLANEDMLPEDEDTIFVESKEDVLLDEESEAWIGEESITESETEIALGESEGEFIEQISVEEESESEEEIQNDAGALYMSNARVGYSRVVEADVPVSDSVTTVCSYYTGSNLEAQDYHVWSAPIGSYLVESPDGRLMLIQAGVLDGGTLLVEYYDKQYNLQTVMTLKLSLPIFGGFFEDENYYYVLTGNKNTECDDAKEVYRLTKYSKDWKELECASLFGANTTIPFESGTARMTKSGKYLFVRTCHIMYGGHQANVTFSVDTSSMTVIDKFTGILDTKVGYVSHSFNQFIQADNGTLLGCDHGDSYPREIVLLKYPTDISNGKFKPKYSVGSGCKEYKMMPITAFGGGNYTGVSQGGFEYSDSSYLVAGNEDTDGEYSSRNVFLSSVPKEGGTVTIRYFSDYAGTDDSASTPHLIKIGSNSFILMWSSNGYVYYTAIDGHGQQVGITHKMAGNLSDCVPTVVDGKLTWYAWKNEHITFYEINLSDISINNAVRIENGHHYEWDVKVSNSQIREVCRVCGDSIPYVVPTSIQFEYYILDDCYATVKDKFFMASEQDYQVRWSYRFPESELGRMSDIKISSSDSSILAVEQKSSTQANLKPLKTGRVTITVQDGYNSEAICKTEVYVNIIKEEMVSFSCRYFNYDGTEHTVNLNIYNQLYNLKEGTDYKVTYQGDHTNAGTSSVTVTGIGKMAGSITADIVIEPKNIYSYGVRTEMSSENLRYNGQPQSPGLTIRYENMQLIEGRDYVVSYTNNVNTGTAEAIITGIGNYTGAYKQDFEISKADIADCKVSLAANSMKYDGTEKKPEIFLKNGSIYLKEDVDYSVYYTNNRNPGTAMVYIMGIGNYEGYVSTTFTITDNTLQRPSETVPSPIPGGNSTQVFEWIPKEDNQTEKANPTANQSQTGSSSQTEGSSSTTKPDTITVQPATSGKTPAVPSGLSLKSKAKGKVIVSWKKVKNITSYQVQYSNNKNMKKAKTITVKKTAKSTVIKNLKRKKNCYVRIRTIRKKGKKKYYSKWSKIKSVKVK